MIVRTRFAPSPTGSLHLGNARIAVLNWLFARGNAGTFVLRIEDTDAEREVPGAEQGIVDDLLWLGLNWDEGPRTDRRRQEGPYAPYRQSQRIGIYQEHARRLVAAGQSFACYCSDETLERKRQEALRLGLQPHYDGSCRRLASADARALERSGQRPALRFSVPESGEIVVCDAIRGEVRFDAAEISDFVILRSDGRPTYNFAVVVDDASMEITHVIRGIGHLSNTPRQLLLYAALGFAAPQFAHVPFVMGADRQKLSKRHGAQALADYRRMGFHPDAVVNYLSLLSWSSDSGEELLTREQLLAEISLQRVRAADTIFDEGKLRWLSAKHIERMPLQELVGCVEPFVDRVRFPLPKETLPAAIAAVRSHLSTFAEINDHLQPFLPGLDREGVNQRDTLLQDEAARLVIRVAHAELGAIEDWSQEAIQQAFREVGAKTGRSGRSLYEPLRVVLTGRKNGPPLPALCFVFGRETTGALLGQALPII